MVTSLTSKSFVAGFREAGKVREKEAPEGQRNEEVGPAETDVDDRWWLWRSHLTP